MNTKELQSAAPKPEASGELIAKGRELLSLREKTTPGPWLIRWKSNSLHKPPPPDTAYTFGDFILNVGSDEGGEQEALDIEFLCAAHELADWIAAAMPMLEGKGGVSADNESRLVVELLVAGGFVKPEKVEEAREIVRKLPNRPASADDGREELQRQGERAAIWKLANLGRHWFRVHIFCSGSHFTVVPHARVLDGLRVLDALDAAIPSRESKPSAAGEGS